MRKFMIFEVLLFLVCLGNVVCASEDDHKYYEAITKAASIAKRDPIEQASMINLLANPDKYGGKRIEIAGYLDFSGEYNSIYYSKEASVYGSTRDSVTVQLKVEDRDLSWPEIKEKYNARYARVFGRFDNSINNGLTSGTVVDVELILLVPREYGVVKE